MYENGIIWTKPLKTSEKKLREWRMKNRISCARTVDYAWPNSKSNLCSGPAKCGTTISFLSSYHLNAELRVYIQIHTERYRHFCLSLVIFFRSSLPKDFFNHLFLFSYLLRKVLLIFLYFGVYILNWIHTHSI